MIDNVAYLLFALGSIGVFTLYMTVNVFLKYTENKDVDMYKAISSGIIPLAVLGAYVFIVALYGQLTWPLPAPYDQALFNPLISVSLVIVGFTLSAWKKQKMHYVGLFSLLAGLATLFYGIQDYSAGLTQIPTAFAILYVSFGMVAVLAFPVSLIMDLRPGKTRNHPRIWGALLALFWMFLIIAIMTAFLVMVYNGPGP